MQDPGKPVRKWRLTFKLKKLINARLKLFTEDEMMLASSNLSKSKFHRGENDKGLEYCDPIFLFRSEDQVNKWLTLQPHAPVEEQKKGRLMPIKSSMQFDEDGMVILGPNAKGRITREDGKEE